MARDGGEIVPASEPQPDSMLVKARARAWRLEKLPVGICTGSVDLADAERIDRPYYEKLRYRSADHGSIAPADIPRRIVEEFYFTARIAERATSDLQVAQLAEGADLNHERI